MLASRLPHSNVHARIIHQIKNASDESDIVWGDESRDTGLHQELRSSTSGYDGGHSRCEGLKDDVPERIRVRGKGKHVHVRVSASEFLTF